MNILKIVQDLHTLAQYLVGKDIWEKNKNQGSASHLLPAEPIQAQSFLLKTVGALCLDLLCRERARELKSIDAVCVCDCRMPSLTGVTFKWNLQAPCSFRWFSKLSCIHSLWLTHLFSPLMKTLQLRTKILKARNRWLKAEVDTKGFTMPVTRFEFVTECSVTVFVIATVIIIVIFIIFYGMKIYLASQLTNKYSRRDCYELTFLLSFWGPLPGFKFLSPSQAFKPEL